MSKTRLINNWRNNYIFSLILLILFFHLNLLGIKNVKLEKQLNDAIGEERISVLAELTDLYSAPEPQKAIQYGYEALKLLKTVDNKKIKADILNSLGFAKVYLGEYNESLKITDQSIKIAQKINYKKGHADAIYYKAWNYYYQGIYDKATTFLTQSQKIYQSLNSTEGSGNITNLIGLIHLRIGNYSQSIEYLFKALKIRENLKDQSLKTKLSITSSYNNIGLVYLELAKFSLALEYFLKAKEMNDSFDNKRGVAINLNNIALVYRGQKKFSESLKYYNESVKFKQILGLKRGLAISFYNMSAVYEEMGKYQTALKYLKKALKLSETLGNPNVKDVTLVKMGKIMGKLGQYESALKLVNEGLEISKSLNDNFETMKAYDVLSDIYKDLKDYKQALYYSKKNKAISDKLFNETSSKEIAEMQTLFELENKEKEIALLRKTKEVRKFRIERGKNLNRLIILISILVFIVMLVMYIRYRLKVLLTQALNKEVSEHKQTELKLMESEEKFKKLAESSHVGIYISQENSIQYVNPKLLSLFKYQEHELINQNPLILVKNEDKLLIKDKMKQRLQQLIEGRDSVRYEFKGLTKNGEILHLESYGGKIQYQGKPAVLETIIDISERKNTTEKLLRSQKLEAMGILAGGIAHDFNNLLITLVGYLGAIKDNLHINTPAYLYFKKIENAHNQAAELGQKLISFSKGGWILPKETTIATILKNIIDSNPELEDLIDSISFPKNLKTIYGDDRQLMQVLINLLNNSNEAVSDPQKGKIKVSIKAQNIFLPQGNKFYLAEGDYVWVSIMDNGKGIAPALLDTIFEPFFSTKSPDNQKQKGKGLGLAICHSIIKKHHGHIILNSQLEKGTTVELFLPAFQWISF